MHQYFITKKQTNKAFSQKAYWIAIAIMLLVLLANEITPIVTGNFKHRMEEEKALSGAVIDDEFLANVQQNEAGAENPITFFIKSSTGSTDVTGHTADELYAKRTEVNTKLMVQAGISEADQQWWLNKDKENVAPFKYTYCTAYSSYFEIAGYMNSMILILSIIAMVLSQFTMSHVATIGIMIFVMFMAMINIPDSMGIIYSIWNSIPGATVGSWKFNDYHLVGHLTNLGFVPIMWLVAGVILVLAARASYVRYQVKAR